LIARPPARRAVHPGSAERPGLIGDYGRRGRGCLDQYARRARPRHYLDFRTECQYGAAGVYVKRSPGARSDRAAEKSFHDQPWGGGAPPDRKDASSRASERPREAVRPIARSLADQILRGCLATSLRVGWQQWPSSGEAAEGGVQPNHRTSAAKRIGDWSPARGGPRRIDEALGYAEMVGATGSEDVDRRPPWGRRDARMWAQECGRIRSEG